MNFLNFNNARLAAKVFTVVGALCLVAGIIAGVGIFALSSMNTAAHNLETAGLQVAKGADMEVMITAINRGEYHLAADPSEETIAEVKKEFAEERARLEEDLAVVEASADSEQAQMLKGIHAAVTAYEAELDKIVALAEESAHLVTLGGAQREILEEVNKGAHQAEALEHALSQFLEYTEAKEHTMAQNASDTFRNASIVLAVVAAVGLLTGLVLAWYIAQQGIVGPIRKLTENISRLSEGDTDIEIGFDGMTNEVGQMAAAMRNLRIAVFDAFRLSQMVEEMPTGVMQCDPKSFEITYLNKFSRETLKSIEQYLPVKADEMQGQCIDIFHKNPAHQRSLLSDPKNLPHKALISVGPEILDLLVTPINDKNGNYIGPMLSWSVVTEKVKADAESARLMQMVELMPTGVMQCDPKSFEITYLNKFSRENLLR